jgi:hypothetical protein
MSRVVLVVTIVFAALHVISGLMSVCVGVAASVQSEMWLAHTVSPIWSGAFFAVTGLLGLACLKRPTAYLIMCFAAFSVVSLVTAVVSIQLLRLGLVSPTTSTGPKQRPDTLTLVALTVASTECVLCVVSSFISCRLAKAAKEELQRRGEGTYHTAQTIGEKDIMIISRDVNGGIEKT